MQLSEANKTFSAWRKHSESKPNFYFPWFWQARQETSSMGLRFIHRPTKIWINICWKRLALRKSEQLETTRWAGKQIDKTN